MQEDIRQEQALQVAERIVTTMKTEGWGDISQILEENINALDTLTDVDTYDEVKARRVALKALRQFHRDLLGIKEGLELRHRQEDIKLPEPLIKTLKQ